MTKEKLNQVFEECRRTRSGIVIDLKMPNQEYPERIINHYIWFIISMSFLMYLFVQF